MTILGAAVVAVIEDGQQVLDIALTLPTATSILSGGPTGRHVVPASPVHRQVVQ